MARFLSVWRNLLRRGRVERDLDDEVRAMFDLLVEERVRAGMPREEARRAARMQFGGVEAVKDGMRDTRAGAFADTLVRDLRYAMRQLRRQPLFTATATLSLAIGIGAPTTIFTVANGLLMRAAAGISEPDRIVDIVPSGLTEPVLPFRVYDELRRHTTTIDALFAFQLDLTPVSMRARDGAERVFASLVTPNYFTTLGVRPAAGRLFSDEDGPSPGASPFVVLGHHFWTDRFGADPGIVGRTVRFNGRDLTVVGVAARGFRGTSVMAPDVWLPVSLVAVVQPNMEPAWLRLMIGGRLRPGASVEQAAAEIDTLSRAIGGDRLEPAIGMPGDLARQPGLRVVASSPIPGNLRVLAAGFLTLLMLLVSLVLVIASSNLAGVQLARTDARRREMAVRLAIGADRRRLTRQLLTETVVLFLLGGAAGLLLAGAATSIVLLLLPALPMPANLPLALDGRVVAFATALSVIAALLTGLGPALHASRADIVGVLKSSEQGPSDRFRLRTAFVVTQVAFSILLVVLAGLLVRGFGRVSAVDRGFDPRGVEVAEIDLSMAGHTEATGAAFATRLLERIRQVPGVRAATVADRAPAPGRFMVMLGESLTVPGAAPTTADRFTPNWTIVAPGYFATIGLPLVAGRDFSAADTASTEPVVIVTAATARRLWPGQDAVGRHIRWHRPGPPGGAATITQARVIGVASDLKAETGASAATVRRDGERAIAVMPVSLYAPVLQRYRPRLSILARATDGRRLATGIRNAVTTMDPDLAILAAQTLDEQLAGPEEIQLRIAASLSGSLGLIGLVLAAIGVYGVTAYTVTRRTREIGVRLALGAAPADVTRMVLRHGLRSLVIGSIVGLALAAGAGRLLASGLHGVPPLDPLAFVGSAVLFAAVGIGACYVPVRRAVRINAMEALRCE